MSIQTNFQQIHSIMSGRSTPSISGLVRAHLDGGKPVVARPLMILNKTPKPSDIFYNSISGLTRADLPPRVGLFLFVILARTRLAPGPSPTRLS